MAKKKPVIKQRDAKYWLNRAEARKRYMESLWPTAAKSIASMYRDVAYQMQDKVAAFYGRFGQADAKGNIVVGFQDAMKPMSPREFGLFKNKVETAKRKYAKTLDEPFKAQLAQYGRSVTAPRFLQLDLDAQLLSHDAAVFQMQKTAGMMATNTATAYYYTTTEIETALGVGLKYGAMNARQVRDIISRNWSGQEFSARIWGDRAKLGTDLKRVLVEGFTQRKRNAQMAELIADRFDVAYSSAERLVRTESANVVEQATKDAYTEAGVEEYEYSAILDERTSEICTELDGQRFALADAMVGVNYPPMHPNCRSTTLPVFDGVTPEVASAERPYDSFEEWKQANGDKKIDAVAKDAAEPWVRIV